MELPRRWTKLLWLEVYANQAGADSKLGAILEHGRAHAFFVVKRAVCRIHVLQVDMCVSYFQQAVTP